jgi:hypothetical protein
MRLGGLKQHAHVVAGDPRVNGDGHHAVAAQERPTRAGGLVDQAAMLLELARVREPGMRRQILPAREQTSTVRPQKFVGHIVKTRGKRRDGDVDAFRSGIHRAVEQQDFHIDVGVKFGEFSNQCVEAEKSERGRDLYPDRAGQSPHSLAQFGQGLIVRGNYSDDPLQMVLSVGAQDNLAGRAVKQRRAHDPLELRDALGDDRGHQIELLRSSTEASRFRDATKARIEAIVSILHDSRKLNRRQVPFSVELARLASQQCRGTGFRFCGDQPN